ncbi:hypothetical protein RCL1_007933 [Eukaryota sp. TZLM3-RCL]
MDLLAAIPSHLWRPRRLKDWSFRSLDLPLTTFKPYQYLFKVGDIPQIFVLVSGSVQITCELVSQQVEVVTLGPGAIIGDLTVLRSLPSAYDAVTQSDVSAYVISQDLLHTILSDVPKDVSTILFETSKVLSSVFFDYLPAFRSFRVSKSQSNIHCSSLESLPVIAEFDQFELTDCTSKASLHYSPSAFVSYDEGDTPNHSCPVSHLGSLSQTPYVLILKSVDLNTLSELLDGDLLSPLVVEITMRCLERLCGSIAALSLADDSTDSSDDSSDSELSLDFEVDNSLDHGIVDRFSSIARDLDQVFSSDVEAIDTEDSETESDDSFRRDSISSEVSAYSTRSDSYAQYVDFLSKTKAESSTNRRHSIAGKDVVDFKRSRRNSTSLFKTTSFIKSNLPIAAALIVDSQLSRDVGQNFDSDDFISELSEVDEMILPDIDPPEVSLFRSDSAKGIAGDDHIYISGSPPAASFNFLKKTTLPSKFSSLEPIPVEPIRSDTTEPFANFYLGMSPKPTNSLLHSLNPYCLPLLSVKKFEKILSQSKQPSPCPLNWNFDSWKVGQSKSEAIDHLTRLFSGYLISLAESEPGFSSFVDNFDPQSIVKFVQISVDGYKDSIAFHNASHALAVTSSMIFLLRCRPISTCIAPIDRIALVIACITHDIFHPGVGTILDRVLRPDSYNIKPLRRKSSSEVTLEDLHYEGALKVINDSGLFDYLSDDDRESLLKSISTCIAATDLMLHFSTLNEVQKVARKLSQPWRTQTTSTRKLLLKLLMKFIDLDNQSKSSQLSVEAAMRVCFELFHQGDCERRLSLSVPASRDRLASGVISIQIEFISIFVEPLLLTVVKIFPFLRPFQSFLELNSKNYKNLTENLWPNDTDSSIEAVYNWYKKQYNSTIPFFEKNNLAT